MPPGSIEELDVADEDHFAGVDTDRFEMADQQRSAAQTEARKYRPGTLVRHPQFGLGRVLTVNASGSQTRAQVQFNASGVKTLVLQYARLEIVQRDEDTY
jgi:DNA helicase-2/ATP-dependent DNA helicase PcrA